MSCRDAGLLCEAVKLQLRPLATRCESSGNTVSAWVGSASEENPPEIARRLPGQVAVAVAQGDRRGPSRPAGWSRRRPRQIFGAPLRQRTIAVSEPVAVVSGLARSPLAIQLFAPERRDSVTTVGSIPPGAAGEAAAHARVPGGQVAVAVRS